MRDRRRRETDEQIPTQWSETTTKHERHALCYFHKQRERKREKKKR